MKPYKPSNQVPIVGLAFLAVTLVAGAAIGGLVGLISKAIYLVLIFPILMGAVGGAVVKVAVNGGKVRSPVVAAVFGLLTGVLMFAVMHGVQYSLFRAEMKNMIVEELSGLLDIESSEAGSLGAMMVVEDGDALAAGDAQAVQAEQDLAGRLFDEILAEETGSAGFWGYMLLQAKEGVSIGRVFGSSEINLGTTLSWVYWLAEIAVAAGIVAYGGWQAAGRPFCESCDRWYGQKVHLGGVQADQGEELLSALRLEGLDQAGAMLQGDTELPSLEVHVQGCPGCDGGDSRLAVTGYSLNSKGKVTTRQVAEGMISPSQKAELLRAIVKAGRTDVGDGVPEPVM